MIVLSNDNYATTPHKDDYCITCDNYIIVLTGFGFSFDDIAEEFSYQCLSPYPHSLITSTITSNDIVTILRDTTEEEFRKTYHEYFI